ncbi:MAG: ATP-binding protein [Acidimicrobiales bacterium]
MLVQALGLQRCLVVLDNCEHVLDEVAAIAENMVRACPTVALLATSREALGVSEEGTIAVRPLHADDAVALFVGRVSLHDDSFGVGPADAELVMAICDRLDGLAIELAAARARTMPLEDFLARLGERFRLLRGQRRATERHQTPRATVAWSYDLLPAPERDVFARLSVFAGGFTLTAAEAICADDEPAAPRVGEVVRVNPAGGGWRTQPPGRSSRSFAAPRCVRPTRCARRRGAIGGMSAGGAHPWGRTASTRPG